ncbi:hypothetical protein TG4357_02768 [Thalassovita gelatinovora]|uniref:DUF4177 domain-containing protein n=2 Tax=Thalassovita gelatinovora TaxID=53501 RepID=A0A0P1G2B5_THAGE|nr:hypothetical protein TG4357_02768 [Thalassovita gelatinovora]SEQ46658.1 hypothetical protein SAMN04488043_105306 [Thalassovita gelatinovora]
MTLYDYKVVPAPARGTKARGIKGPDARFANTIETVLNEMAAAGWEFQRAETLPSEERHGLTHTATTFRTLLVFRRPRPGDISAFAPRRVEPADPRPEADQDETAQDDAPATTVSKTPEQPDNGVEDVIDDEDAISSVLQSRAQQLQREGKQ